MVIVTIRSQVIVFFHDHTNAHPYSSVRLTQMKWNGTVCQSVRTIIAVRFANAKPAHRTSNAWLRLRDIDTIANVPHRLDGFGSEFAPEPADVDIHDVAAWVKRVAPYILEQLHSRAHVALRTHERL